MQELLPMFMAKPVESDEFDHWQGGPAKHDGDYCTECDRPFLLIWDLNGNDPRFQVDGKHVFGGLQRIPLYFCWTCSPTEISYELFSDDIEILKYQGKYQGKSFPYSGYPTSFPRTALQLTARTEYPSDVDQCLKEWNADEDRTELTNAEKDLLSAWLGRPIESAFSDLWIHQLGGETFLFQGLNEQSCPNEDCELYESGQPMRFLANIKNDPLSGLPMLESRSQVEAGDTVCGSFTSLAFYYCEFCYSIRATQDGS